VGSHTIFVIKAADLELGEVRGTNFLTTYGEQVFRGKRPREPRNKRRGRTLTCAAIMAILLRERSPGLRKVTKIPQSSFASTIRQTGGGGNRI